MGSEREGDGLVRIYITREAYRLLGQYMFSRYGTYRGMVRVASELLIKAIRSESSETASQLAKIAQQQGSQPAEPKQPSAPAAPQKPAEKRKQRRRSPLDEVEDIDVIRARNPEALARAAEERGLQARDLAEDGYPGLVAVYKQSFAEFAKTVAEAENPPLQQVEERAREALRGGGKPRSADEKVALMLYILNRTGEILWDGSRWVEPSRAKPAPPLQEQLRQVREGERRAETTAVSPEKPAPQQQTQQAQPAPQQPQAQLDEKTKRWLEFFEKEFPRLKTAMLVWSVKSAEALRRLAEQHGLVYYAITAEKAVVLNRGYVRDACAYANDRRWTREKVADMVADTLRSKPHALTDDEVAALALEVALSLGLAEHKGGKWLAK
jgi:hypothetical protein